MTNPGRQPRLGRGGRVARKSTKDLQYVDRARLLNWAGIQELWDRIRQDQVTEWDDGKAFEHVIIRGFELSGFQVEYPYHVPPGGSPIEQIDGVVHFGHLVFLIECKDQAKTDIEAIAKLSNQLARPPPTTMGCVIVSNTFTAPALILADYSLPHRILLWSGEDVSVATRQSDFKSILQKKYEDLCLYGLTDFSPNYKDLEEL
jgi:hypothetical protein